MMATKMVCLANYNKTKGACLLLAQPEYCTSETTPPCNYTILKPVYNISFSAFNYNRL